MRLSELDEGELRFRLNSSGLKFGIGTFNVLLRTPLPIVCENVIKLYEDYPLVPDEGFIDFHVELRSPSTTRHYFRPQVAFYFDGHNPFKPLPQDQAFAMFEWGLNWCIANAAHQFLNIHAAVVEKDGVGLVLPGSPGSGKSTLCAGLLSSGWRLLSDEMGLVALDGRSVVPVPRPIGLKNNSIQVIKSLLPNMPMSSPVDDTAKGSVAHLKPPRESLEMAAERADPKLLIFPKYDSETDTRLTPIGKGYSVLKIADNSFNYNILGVKGFRVMSQLVDQMRCFDLQYANMAEAISLINELAGSVRQAS
ncbi:MAG: HprK-related kinase A [bacterium]